ncbi:hypothetical protein [Micromonospora sediminimaris]|uniref:hypothetical protein n=1 Tax=Micromonospora sediminimaris TaxID=547162 RepID=UPI0008E1CA50|nr:hypothetical protein [Micromonospora sediminimaris]SFC02637.1 hypothetical protein SAMN05216284_102252 [Micromonospora sediminimaris]
MSWHHVPIMSRAWTENLLNSVWSGPGRLLGRSGARAVGRLAAAAGAAVALALAAGCADAASPPSGPSPSAGAVQQDLHTWLHEGAKKVGQDTYSTRFTMTRRDVEGASVSTTVEMTVDPARRRSDMAIRFPIRQPGHFQWIEIKTVDEKSWMRIFGFGEPPEGWLPVDLPRLLGADSSLFIGTQATDDLQELVKTSVELRLVTERAVRGVLDLRRHPHLTVELRRELSATNTMMPFDATLDAQGRLTNLTLHFDQAEAGAGQWQFLYHSFGRRQPIEPPPAGDVLEPADLDPQLLAELREVGWL